MAKFYAWSNFPLEANDYGQITKTLKCGEEVSQQKLGISKEDWDELVENGAVSEEPYPDIPDYMSPMEYNRSQIAADSAVAQAEELRLNPVDAAAVLGGAQTTGDSNPPEATDETPKAGTATSGN